MRLEAGVAEIFHRAGRSVMHVIKAATRRTPSKMASEDSPSAAEDAAMIAVDNIIDIEASSTSSVPAHCSITSVGHRDGARQSVVWRYEYNVEIYLRLSPARSLRWQIKAVSISPPKRPSIIDRAVALPPQSEMSSLLLYETMQKCTAAMKRRVLQS